MFLLLFTKSQFEKNILKKHSLWVQALKKDEDQQVRRKLCHNIYWIQKINFQKCKFMKSIFVSLSTDKITKRISLKVFKIMDFKIMENRLIISTESSKGCNICCFFNCFSTFCGWIKTLIPYFCVYVQYPWFSLLARRGWGDGRGSPLHQPKIVSSPPAESPSHQIFILPPHHQKSIPPTKQQFSSYNPIKTAF